VHFFEYLGGWKNICSGISPRWPKRSSHPCTHVQSIHTSINMKNIESGNKPHTSRSSANIGDFVRSMWSAIPLARSNGTLPELPVSGQSVYINSIKVSFPIHKLEPIYIYCQATREYFGTFRESVRRWRNIGGGSTHPLRCES
jgi:hypothetical protein